MTPFDLLDTVLAPDGWFCVFSIRGKVSPKQKLVATREELDREVANQVEQGRDVFFGCAKFGTNENREQENAKYFKSFWMDIDCGPSKATPDSKTGKIAGYIDQETGLAELKRFCKVIGLPKPIIVNSGRGLHVYWPLTNVISQEQWKPVSKRIRQLCVTHKLIVDPACFESSRVLRVPGTFNFKDDGQLPVEVIAVGKPIEYEELVKLLGVTEKPVTIFDAMPQRPLSALTMSLIGNRVSKFKTIMMKSMKGEGCAQLKFAYENQESLEEPIWRGALSIAQYCTDRVEGIHKMSYKHPDYDAVETDKKAQLTKGPYTCEVFDAANPNTCGDCQWKGKFKSPITLGREIARDEPTEDGYEVEVVEEVEGEVEGEVELVKVKHVIPEYPYPYFRGKEGGIYMTPLGEEEEPRLVYENDIYIVKRMSDLNSGEMVLIRLHLPKDGVREFSAPLTQVVAKDELRKLLAMNGVAGHQKQMDALAGFFITSVKDLQTKKKAEMMRSQFGWADNDSKFIVGDREITVDGIAYSPPSTATRDIAEHMVPCGTLEKWSEVFNLYSRPGLEGSAFAALTGFGAPLLKFLGLSGAVINVIYKSSGSGKSTTLFMCNSIWGNPDRLVAIPRDTMNARMHRLGVMNNLPFTMDEITNMEAKDFSDMVYAMSQGRGKDRVKASSNEMRVNHTSWRNLSLASANASFYQKLGALKSSPDGESMRLLEYELGYSNAISTEEGKDMFDHQLRENYGHAGDIYALHLVRNKERIIQTLLTVQAKLDKELGLTQRERFWSAIVACNITGGMVASSELGLIDYDMAAIYKWACNMVREVRADITPPAADASSIIGDYINRHVRNTLVVNGEADARTSLFAAPTQEPYGDLLIRFEPDTKMMYFSAKAFKDDCVRIQVDYKNTLRQLEAKGVYKGTASKRLNTGTKIKGTAIHALVFDTNHEDFVSVEEIVTNEVANASSGSDVPN